MVFRGNIVSNVTANTPSDQGMLFGTFLMQNIFINFPTLILNYIFGMISSKNPMIFIGFICTTMLYSHITIKFASKKHENFDEIEQNMIQNRSWKIDENIFHEKCPKQHSLVTGSVCGDV